MFYGLALGELKKTVEKLEERAIDDAKRIKRLEEVVIALAEVVARQYGPEVHGQCLYGYPAMDAILDVAKPLKEGT